VIVVADASPLRYLILIEHTHVLPALYGHVIVPPAVITELTHERTPTTRHAAANRNRRPTLRRIILRERWRTSSLPSVPSALRGL
jgi:predicted nucleic acid-binding protein